MESHTLYEVMAARSGRPAPNMDPETGIRYGFIPSSHVCSEAVDDICSDGRDLNWEAAVGDIKRSIRGAHSDDPEEIGNVLKSIYTDLGLKEPEADVLEEWAAIPEEQFVEEVWNEIEDRWGQYSSDGSSSYLYEQDGYSIQLGSDGDLIVMKSPYVALRGLCSPCAPNGCYLETDGNLKCYALGPEWFDEYSPMPYGAVKIGALPGGKDSQ